MSIDQKKVEELLKTRKTCGFFCPSFSDDDKCTHKENAFYNGEYGYCDEYKCPILGTKGTPK